eukprot:GHVO01050904.1.p2 GENE.GHVO01050904.1~~GHVO01050904.1.p2  ORF type:complete len:109 (-),score=8.47 GHVO01050904.1:19-345(-)
MNLYDCAFPESSSNEQRFDALAINKPSANEMVVAAQLDAPIDPVTNWITRHQSFLQVQDAEVDDILMQSKTEIPDNGFSAVHSGARKASDLLDKATKLRQHTQSRKLT